MARRKGRERMTRVPSTRFLECNLLGPTGIDGFDMTHVGSDNEKR